jgi:SAM-dependent methyltransferase
VNHWLGGASLSAAAIAALAAHRRDLTILDVGTGGADIPIALLAAAQRAGRHLQIVGTDSRPEVLEAAAIALPAVTRTEGLTLEVADGRSLPYNDGAFDVVHTSMVLHHLEPHEGTLLMREMARVARLGIVVNDLDRARRFWVGAWLMSHTLTGNRFTRHDAPLSVRRAYRLDAALGLVRVAGLAPVRAIRGPFGHRYAIAAVVPTALDQLGAGGLDRA